MKNEVVVSPLLTPRQAAELLSLNPRTLVRWARERRIAHAAIGGRAKDGRAVGLRFRLSDLEAHIRGTLTRAQARRGSAGAGA